MTRSNNQEFDFREQRKKRYHAPHPDNEPSPAVETGMPWPAGQWADGDTWGLPDDFCYNPSNNVQQPVDTQQEELALAYQASKQSRSQLPPANVPKTRSQRKRSGGKQYQKFSDRYGQPNDTPTRETKMNGLYTVGSFLDNEESTNSRASSLSPPTIDESRPVTDVELASYTDLGSPRFHNDLQNDYTSRSKRVDPNRSSVTTCVIESMLDNERQSVNAFTSSRRSVDPSETTYAIQSMLEDEYEEEYDDEDDDDFSRKKGGCRAPPCTCCIICLLIIGGILLGYYQFDKFGQGSKNEPVSVTTDSQSLTGNTAPTEAPTGAPTLLGELATQAATVNSTQTPNLTSAPSGDKVNGNDTGLTATTLVPKETDAITSETLSPTATEPNSSSSGKAFNVTAGPTPEATTEMATTSGPLVTPVPTTPQETTPKPTTSPVATPEPTTSPVATPEPTTSPVATPKPSTSPVATPEPTKSPVATPAATQEPTTLQPTTSSPTVKLTLSPTTMMPTSLPTISPTIVATSQAVASPPTGTDQATDPQLVELALVGNDGLPAEVFPLGLCEGDCDSDSEEKGLICFQREAGDPVPGCLGINDWGNDFCVAKPPQMTLRNIRVYVSDHFHIYGTESIRPEIVFREQTYYPWEDLKWFYPYEQIERGAWYPLANFEDWCHPTSGCSDHSLSPGAPLELRINVRDDSDLETVTAFGWTIEPATWFFPQRNYETTEVTDAETGKFLKWKFDVVDLSSVE